MRRTTLGGVRDDRQGARPGEPAGDWDAAHERARREVAAAFAPRRRACRACGAERVTASRTCPACGAPYVAYRSPRWSRRSRRRLVAAGLLVVLLAGLGAVVLGPGIERAERRRAAEERTRLARARSAERARLTRVQRLGVARVAPAPAGGVGARRAMVRALEARVATTAARLVRARELRGPIETTFCIPYPNGGADPARGTAAVGRYACTAVVRFIRAGSTPASRGALGHPFWGRVWFARGGLAWCKITPRAGERLAGLELADVPLAPACDLAARAGDDWPPRR